MAESQHSVIFVNRHRAALIQRVSQVKPLADALLSQGLIQEETYTNICAAATRQDRMRELYAALHCTGDRAKAAFYTILKDAEPYLVEDLGPLETEIRGDPQSSGSVSDCCGEEELGKKYQEWVRCEYSTVQEYNHLPGEDVQLENRYTKLLIIQKHRQQKEREEELRCRGDSFQEVMNKRNCDEFMSTSVENLFDPDENGAVRRTVILQGQAGIGKSFTAQKIMFDWASGKLYSEIFLYIFHIKCRQLNLIGENISVVNLILNNSQHLAPVVTEILCSSEKILFIIDGFDELKYSLDVSHSLSHDLHEQNSPAITLSRLMRKVILPECFLLITTRSTALDKLTRVLKQPRYTEILGFSEEGMKTYFQNFFQDKKQAVDAFNYVKRNQIMFTTCFIPVICWIVCTVLRQQLEEGTNINHALSTTTTIFVYFVDTLLEHHCKSLRLPVQDVLRRLGALAESGIREQRVLFDDKHIQDIFPDPSQVPSSFLNKILLRKRIFKQAVYSFMHLSFQEFFTAFSYVLCDDKEAEEKVAELLAESKEKNKRHILMTIRFLFGLSNSETADLLKEKYNHSISPAIRFLLEGWIKEVIKMNNFIFGDNGLINILHFLYEIHEKDFVTLAMDNFKELDLSFQPLKRTDCAVVTYCLQACRRFERLNLRSCNLKSEELEMLLPVLPKCQSLDLQHNHLGDKGLTMLSKALQSPGCKIKELWQLLDKKLIK
ncbi:NACHT, LRR and PYD domains-containing protein 3 [Amia ocellicauda]|uniref:NACHT, LRR and PYD domains-containing protein 3 n=1 Tax=Amia ocellicauda TaxID=2972642 RepID=UPI003464A909